MSNVNCFGAIQEVSNSVQWLVPGRMRWLKLQDAQDERLYEILSSWHTISLPKLVYEPGSPSGFELGFERFGTTLVGPYYSPEKTNTTLHLNGRGTGYAPALQLDGRECSVRGHTSNAIALEFRGT